MRFEIRNDPGPTFVVYDSDLVDYELTENGWRGSDGAIYTTKRLGVATALMAALNVAHERDEADELLVEIAEAWERHGEIWEDRVKEKREEMNEARQ